MSSASLRKEAWPNEVERAASAGHAAAGRRIRSFGQPMATMAIFRPRGNDVVFPDWSET
jgi:hypothetical protein